METTRKLASVDVWLSDLGLGAFRDRFLAADIDLSVMPLLTDDDLKEIGITSLGHRRKLMSAAAKLDDQQPKDDDAGLRRFVTVMFCDIVGSTQMAEALDSEDYSELLSRFYATVQDVAQRFGGHVAQFLGDGALIYFGSPTPLEDAAVRAAMAAQQLHDAVYPLTESGLMVRNGLASGLVVIDPEPTGNAHAFGPTVNLAARLMGVAQAGTTVASETTASLVSPAFDARLLGDHALKGIEGKRKVFELTATAQSALEQKRLTPNEVGSFVGRSHELATMGQALDQAARTNGACVFVCGEAGIGKSRLVGEFVTSAQSGGAGLRMIECTPLATSVPYFPIMRALAESARGGDADAQTLLDRLQGADAAAPVDARGWREETRAALVRFFTKPTGGAAEVSWVEDIHWADPSTLEVVQGILAAPGAGRLSIVSSRLVADLERLAPAAGVDWVHVKPLSAAQTSELVRKGLGAKGSDDHLVKILTDRADGVPIFAEELANALRFSGGSDGAIPASLQQSLQARIERLGPGRALLRLASAMARVAPLKLLRLLWTGPGPIEAAAIELVDAGFARLQSGFGTKGETALEIRHQLMRECAYDMILSRDRARIHGAIADLILGPEGRGLSPGIIAEQLERAGRAQAAAEHWAEAGRLAASQSAYAEAAALYQRALDQIPAAQDAKWGEPFEADVLFKLYPVLIGQGGYIQIDASFRARLASVATRRGDPRSAFAAVFVEWLTLYAAGEIDKAHELGQSLSTLAQADQTGVSQLALDRMLGNSHLFRGELKQAETYITRFIATFDAAQHRAPLAGFGASDNLVVMYSSLAVLRALEGDTAACTAAAKDCQAAALTVGQIQSYCTATGFGGAFPMLLIGDYAAAANYAAQLSAKIEGQNLTHWEAYRDMFAGIIQIADAQSKAGEAQFKRGLDAITQHGDRFLVATLTTLADEARASVGSPPGGHGADIAHGESRGERWLVPRSAQFKV